MERIRTIHQTYYLMIMIAVALLGVNWTPSLNTQVLLLAAGVALIGIAHGAIDHRFGRVLFERQFPRFWFLPFRFFYLGLAGLMAGVWIWDSRLGLAIFFLMAVPHFGFVDAEESYYSDSRYYVSALTVGTFPIVLPAFFSPVDVSKIFNWLMISGGNFTPSVVRSWALPVLMIVLLVKAVLLVGRLQSEGLRKAVLLDGLESIAMVGLFWSTPALIGFLTYYCAGHSVREALEISRDINPDDLQSGFQEFVRASLPLTGVTLIGGIGVVWLLVSGGFELTPALAVIVFIGLSSLLIPHMLVEYLHEHPIS